MLTPALATAEPVIALAICRAAERFWISFSARHRDITTTLGISAAVHLALLLGIGTALYVTGEDETDVPEMSVQIVTREGPNDEEFSEASLPQPAPDPVEEVLDDPGTGAQTFDAPALAHTSPALQQNPDLSQLDMEAAFADMPQVSGAVLTTLGTADQQVAAELPPVQETFAAPVPKPEQDMLARNVEKLAQQLLDTNETRTELQWQQDGRQYSARVMRQPAADSTGLEQVIAEIVTDKDGKRMKTRLSLKRLAFSHFTQLVNNWDPNIQLHDDIIDGRFHSNTQIALTGMHGIKPKFYGKVTTAAHSMTFNNLGTRRTKDVFQAGFETRTEKVTLPRDMPDVVNGGEEADRRLFSEDTRIIFNPDGSYVWRAANGLGELQRAEPTLRPHYLIADKGAKLYVRGSVSGIYTVYSPQDIEIEDDLVYAKDPRQAVISTDFLALIAGRDISVSRPEITGPGDLTVHAAVFARRRFYIESIDTPRSGILFLYGSLTAGTISATEPRYATKVDFDRRFEYLRPAAFPMTRRYEVDSWNEDWQAVDSGHGAPVSGALAQSQ